jgi:hypothetical protein
MFNHPLVKGAALVAIFVVAAELLVGLTSFAWATVSVPIPLTGYTIDLGELPQWIIALVAAGGLWKSWKAEQHAAIAAKAALASAEQIGLIHKETNSMRAALELAATAKGELAGREKLTAELAGQGEADKATVRTNAIADAESEAKIEAIKNQQNVPDRTKIEP